MTSTASPCDVPTILAMMRAADAHMDALRAAVERLAAENAEMRSALESCVEFQGCGDHDCCDAARAQAMARSHAQDVLAKTVSVMPS